MRGASILDEVSREVMLYEYYPKEVDHRHTAAMIRSSRKVILEEFLDVFVTECEQILTDLCLI